MPKFNRNMISWRPIWPKIQDGVSAPSCTPNYCYSQINELVPIPENICIVLEIFVYIVRWKDLCARLFEICVRFWDYKRISKDEYQQLEAIDSFKIPKFE